MLYTIKTHYLNFHFWNHFYCMNQVVHTTAEFLNFYLQQNRSAIRSSCYHHPSSPPRFFFFSLNQYIICRVCVWGLYEICMCFCVSFMWRCGLQPSLSQPSTWTIKNAAPYLFSLHCHIYWRQNKSAICQIEIKAAVAVFENFIFCAREWWGKGKGCLYKVQLVKKYP